MKRFCRHSNPKETNGGRSSVPSAMFSFATMPDMKPATGCWIKAPAGRSAMPVATITQFLIFQFRENLPLRDLELAKHWLFYTLLRLRLPLKTRLDDPEHGLAFDFVADSPRLTGPRVLTGDDNGLITIAIEEADDAERERRRTHMGEPYRTVLGHFRHEVGHDFGTC